jgi:hypothetical protein
MFLLSRPEMQRSGKVDYYDKAVYIMQEVLSNEEDDMNIPVEKNNIKLKSLCQLLCSVAIEGITSYYR